MLEYGHADNLYEDEYNWRTKMDDINDRKTI